MSLGASFQLHYYYFLSRLPAGLTTNATLLSLFWVEGHGRDGDYFKHSLLIVLLNRLLTCLAALATHLVKRERIHPLAPISAYALVSFSNVVATSCQYEALK